MNFRRHQICTCGSNICLALPLNLWPFTASSWSDIRWHALFPPCLVSKFQTETGLGVLGILSKDAFKLFSNWVFLSWKDFFAIKHFWRHVQEVSPLTQTWYQLQCAFAQASQQEGLAILGVQLLLSAFSCLRLFGRVACLQAWQKGKGEAVAIASALVENIELQFARRPLVQCAVKPNEREREET